MHRKQRTLRDLGQIGLAAQCIAFTVDGFRYPDRVEREAGTIFDIMRQYFIEQASTRGYEAIDFDPLFLGSVSRESERFESPNDPYWNANEHRAAVEALRSSRRLIPPL
jgi:hypothetical protein